MKTLLPLRYVLALVACFCTTFNLFSQVEFKVSLDDAGVYSVSFLPSVTWDGTAALTATGQVSLLVPTGGFEISNLQAINGSWAANSTVVAPEENPGFDYISVGLTSLGTSDIPYVSGQEVTVFTFENAGVCTGPITLMETNDPFASPNSLSINVGNQLTTLGSGNMNAWSGNSSESSANCGGAVVVEILGCTEAEACNFNPAATQNDDSCDFGLAGCPQPCTAIMGCTDATASNYNANANCDDGTCSFVSGCTFADACNFNPNATIDDESCDFGNTSCPDPCNVVLGCTDLTACNYNASATCDDFTCFTPIEGCTDPAACNYLADADCAIDDGSCEYGETGCENPCNAILGCTNPEALNYNAEANCDDDSCEFAPDEIPGCVDPSACNYNPNTNIDDGTCEYGNTACANPCDFTAGCTDPEAINFNANANCENGSCEYPIEIEACGIDLNVEDNTCGLCNGSITVAVDQGLIDGTNQWAFYLFAGEGAQGNPLESNESLTPPINFSDLCQGVYSVNIMGIAGDVVGCVQDFSFIILGDGCPSEVFGCTDPAACNFDSSATIDNEECFYGVEACPDPCNVLMGCTDPTALNFNAEATCNNGTCEFAPDPILGCTDETACNYNPAANQEDESCSYGMTACPDPCNVIMGCTDANATNYNAAANCDNGSCEFVTEIEPAITFVLNQGEDGCYSVSLVSNTTWTGANAMTSTAQVTILVPTGDFEMGDFQSINGEWENNSMVFAPLENEAYDYLTFGLTSLGTTDIDYVAGVEEVLFTFCNVGSCLESVMLMEAGDPFYAPNSLAINAGNQITTLGSGDMNAWAGNNGSISNDCPADAILGCTDPAACNYDPAANTNNDSCVYGNDSCPQPCNVIAGCTDAEAVNFDSAANCDNGSCEFGEEIDPAITYTLTEVDGCYQVGLISNVSWSGMAAMTSTAQVTLLVSTGGFEVSDVQSVNGNWENNSYVFNPLENENYDYVTFGLTSLGTNEIEYIAGQEEVLFTFCNTGSCVESIELMAANDPFYPPNSLAVNAGNQITTFGSGDVNAWAANNGSITNECGTTGPTVIAGCMDAAACNYDPEATMAGVVCNYGETNCPEPCNANFGCTDASANNYDPAANCDDGSCEEDNVIVGPTGPDLMTGDVVFTLLEEGDCYVVGMNPDATWLGADAITSTAQVTLLVPTGTGFFAGNIESYNGTWENNSVVISPDENPDYDYWSFGLTSMGTDEIEYLDGVYTVFFTFCNTGFCPGTIDLMEADDPFAVPNSQNINVGNQITTFGSGNMNTWLSNVGGIYIDCSLVPIPCGMNYIVTEGDCGVCKNEIFMEFPDNLIDGENQWFIEVYSEPNFQGDTIEFNETKYPPELYDELCKGNYSIRITGIDGMVNGCIQEFGNVPVGEECPAIPIIEDPVVEDPPIPDDVITAGPCGLGLEIYDNTCGLCNGQLRLIGAEELEDGINSWIIIYYDEPNFEGNMIEYNVTEFLPDSKSGLCAGTYSISIEGITGAVDGCIQEFPSVVVGGDCPDTIVDPDPEETVETPDYSSPFGPCHISYGVYNTDCGSCNGAVTLQGDYLLEDGVNQWLFEFYGAPYFAGVPIEVNGSMTISDAYTGLCPGVYSLRITGLAGSVDGCVQEMEWINVADGCDINCTQNEFVDACATSLEPIIICPEFCYLGAEYDLTNVVSSLENSTALVSSDCFRYTATAGTTEDETDNVEVTACNENGDCSTLTVVVSFGDCAAEVNLSAINDYVYAQHYAVTMIDPLNNDGDLLGGDSGFIICSVDQSDNGSVDLLDNGLIEYTPEANFSGVDVLSYTICDENGNASTGEIFITVAEACMSDFNFCARPFPHAPAQVCVDLCGAEMEILEIVIDHAATYELGENNCFTYYPNEGFVGSGEISVFACNDNEDCETVNIHVDVDYGCTFTGNRIPEVDEEVLNKLLNDLTIPNEFSPNYDGVNDLYYISGLEYLTEMFNFEMVIFDRMGRLVFEGGYNEFIQGWNGEIDGNGKNTSEGVYYYQIKISDLQNAVSVQKTGFIEIRR